MPDQAPNQSATLTAATMSNRWQVQTAKARFSELLERTIAEGPQIVTRRGIKTAVVVPLEQWRSLQRIASRT